jgi:hypothetical protein
MPQNTLTTTNLNLTSLSNVGGNFTAKWNGKTSLQPIGTVTGLVTLQYSNDNVNFFDLSGFVAIDVNTPIILDSADWAFYRFKVDTVGTGTVSWSVAGSDVVVSSGGGSSSLTLYGLSTNDYTTPEKSKLAGIQSGAEVNVQSDWSETNPASDAFILNKPAITPPISLHSDLTLDDGTNPHGTTKTDVGLSNVLNIDTSTTANISDSTNKRFVTDSQQTAITHSNRSVLDLITESFTTALKTAYDSTVTWISTNGAIILSHLSNTSNPHNVTKTQVGLSNVDNTSDVDKPVSTATQTEIDATNTAFNDFVTVDYINDLNAKQNSLVSGTNIKTIESFSILGSGNLPILDRDNVYIFNDLISATALQPLIGSAISTGTFVQNTTNFSVNSFGVCRTTKSATANSGYRVMSDVNAIRIKGGEIYRQRFCPLNITTATRRMGFHDATSITDAVDGVYAEYSLSGNLVLKASNNSTRTTTSAVATLSLNTWYTIEIIIANGATGATLNLYNSTGVLSSSVSLPTATNIPTGVGRECGVGFITTGSSTTADTLVDDDFFEFKQQLNR